MDPVIARILNLVDNSGITEKQILKELDISNASTITDWRTERSKTPSMKNIIKFANYFKVSTDFLLTGEEKHSELSGEEQEWLNLYRKLPSDSAIKSECIGFVKGYIVGKIPLKGDFSNEQ